MGIMSIATIEMLMKVKHLRFMASTHNGLFIVILQTNTWEESWVGRASTLEGAFQEAHRRFAVDNPG